MHEKDFLKRSVINNRNSDVYIWYMVASWACEVTLILTKKKEEAFSLLLCVRIPVTLQAQQSTILS